nr:hypothetical protein [Tanacetum cinerariifolium]
MHNNIMETGSKDRPPMLAMGRYTQWYSRFLRYIDTRLNGDALRKCILEAPYTPSTVTIPAVPATDESPKVPERTTVETILNMSPKNKAHYESEKEAIHLLLTRIEDEIYSTVNAYKTTHEIWIAIERLQQGESLNIQDVKTNLFWEFRKFTSHDGESMESYCSRFYKMMNEMIRNNLTIATMQVNYQKEVNEIRAERMAKNANPLALVATAQQYPDLYYQAPKPHRSLVQPSKQSSSTRSKESTKYKGKEIAKPNTPPSESTSKEDSDPEEAPRDKDMQKNLALIAKYFKKIYKPTNNNLKTSLNFKNKNVDTSLRYKNENQTWQFGNQRTETKRVKDYSYHKEKMLMYKQAKKGVPLQAEQADWLANMDEEIDEQELKAHYNYMAKIQEVPTVDLGTDTEPLVQVQYDAEYNVFSNEKQHSKQHESISNTCVVEKADSNVIPNSLDMRDNDIQTDQNTKDERVALANLTANLKLDTSRTLGESNSIWDSCLIALQNKQTKLETYKTLNDRTVDYDKLEQKLNEPLGLLAQKEINIKEGLKLKAYEISVVKEKHDELVKQSLLIKSHYEGLVKEKTKVIMDLKLREEKDIDNIISMEKQLKFLNKIVYKKNQLIQTIHMLALKGPTFNGRPTFSNPMYLKKAQSEKPCLYEIPYDISDPANRFVPEREETQTLRIESRLKLNKELVRPYDYTKQNSLYETFKPATHEYHKQLAHANKEKHSHDRFRAPTAHDMEILIKTCLMPLVVKTQNDSFKFVHELKQEMHADLNLKFKTSNINVVCATYGKCVFNLNHDACVSKFLNDVNAKTKKPKVVPISTRKPKSQANKSVATPLKKTVASESTIQKSKSAYRMLYEKTSKAWKWWIEQQCLLGYKWVSKTKNKWIVQLILFIVDSGCTKHITGNLKLLCNFIENYLATVRFGNDQFALILGYRDLVQGNITINRVYYVKASPTQAWLWHQRLSYLNFDYINLLSKKDIVISLPKLKYAKDQLCSSCGVSKAKRSSFKTKAVPSSKGQLNLLHMDLCGPMRVASIEEIHFGTLSVNKSSSPTNNSKQQDTPPITNIQSLIDPTTPTKGNVEENNNNQAVDT